MNGSVARGLPEDNVLGGSTGVPLPIPSFEHGGILGRTPVTRPARAVKPTLSIAVNAPYLLVSASIVIMRGAWSRPGTCSIGEAAETTQDRTPGPPQG